MDNFRGCHASTSTGRHASNLSNSWMAEDNIANIQSQNEPCFQTLNDIPFQRAQTMLSSDCSNVSSSPNCVMKNKSFSSEPEVHQSGKESISPSNHSFNFNCCFKSGDTTGFLPGLDCFLKESLNASEENSSIDSCSVFSTGMPWSKSSIPFICENQVSGNSAVSMIEDLYDDEVLPVKPKFPNKFKSDNSASSMIEDLHDDEILPLKPKFQNKFKSASQKNDHSKIAESQHRNKSGKKVLKTHSYLEEAIDTLVTNDAIVGLDYIIEYKKSLNENATFPFKCKLCNSAISRPSIIDHISGSKHRMSYLKVKDELKYDKIISLKMEKSEKDVIIAEISIELEKIYGRGHVDVDIEENPEAKMGEFRFEDYRQPWETGPYWESKREFMEKYCDKFPEDRLLHLADAYANIAVMNCQNPDPVKTQVSHQTPKKFQGNNDNSEAETSKKGELSAPFVPKPVNRSHQNKSQCESSTSNATDDHRTQPVDEKEICDQMHNNPALATQPVDCDMTDVSCNQDPLENECQQYLPEVNTAPPPEIIVLDEEFPDSSHHFKEDASKIEKAKLIEENAKNPQKKIKFTTCVEEVEFVKPILSTNSSANLIQIHPNSSSVNQLATKPPTETFSQVTDNNNECNVKKMDTETKDKPKEINENIIDCLGLEFIQNFVKCINPLTYSRLPMISIMNAAKKLNINGSVFQFDFDPRPETFPGLEPEFICNLSIKNCLVAKGAGKTEGVARANAAKSGIDTLIKLVHEINTLISITSDTLVKLVNKVTNPSSNTSNTDKKPRSCTIPQEVVKVTNPSSNTSNTDKKPRSRPIPQEVFKDLEKLSRSWGDTVPIVFHPRKYFRFDRLTDNNNKLNKVFKLFYKTIMISSASSPILQKAKAAALESAYKKLKNLSNYVIQSNTLVERPRSPICKSVPETSKISGTSKTLVELPKIPKSDVAQLTSRPGCSKKVTTEKILTNAPLTLKSNCAIQNDKLVEQPRTSKVIPRVSNTLVEQPRTSNTLVEQPRTSKVIPRVSNTLVEQPRTSKVISRVSNTLVEQPRTSKVIPRVPNTLVEQPRTSKVIPRVSNTLVEHPRTVKSAIDLNPGCNKEISTKKVLVDAPFTVNESLFKSSVNDHFVILITATQKIKNNFQMIIFDSAYFCQKRCEFKTVGIGATSGNQYRADCLIDGAVVGNGTSSDTDIARTMACENALDMLRRKYYCIQMKSEYNQDFKITLDQSGKPSIITRDQIESAAILFSPADLDQMQGKRRKKKRSKKGNNDVGYFSKFLSGIGTIFKNYTTSNSQGDLIFAEGFKQVDFSHIRRIAGKYNLDCISGTNSQGNFLVVKRKYTLVDLLHYLAKIGGSDIKYKLLDASLDEQNPFKVVHNVE